MSWTRLQQESQAATYRLPANSQQLLYEDQPIALYQLSVTEQVRPRRSGGFIVIPRSTENQSNIRANSEAATRPNLEKARWATRARQILTTGANRAAEQQTAPRRRGIFLRGLADVPFDRAIDPPLAACYKCWGNHRLTNCHFIPPGPWCNNCGRRGEWVTNCHRCKDAFWRREQRRQKARAELVRRQRNKRQDAHVELTYREQKIRQEVQAELERRKVEQRVMEEQIKLEQQQQRRADKERRDQERRAEEQRRRQEQQARQMQRNQEKEQSVPRNEEKSMVHGRFCERTSCERRESSTRQNWDQTSRGKISVDVMQSILQKLSHIVQILCSSLPANPQPS